MALYVLMCR